MSIDQLSPYTGPWSPRLAAHLLRRAGFGGSPADIAHAADSGMNATVDRLLTFVNDPYPDQPQGDISYPEGPLAAADPNAVKQRRRSFLLSQMWWLNRCLLTANPLQERMVYFWHNHFTSALGQGGVNPSDIVGQLNLYKQMALGHFADLTHAVSRDTAMLLYLNNAENRKQHPNENYARELMELFTMGVGNYSEEDVRQSARAFTGFSIDRTTRAFRFYPRLHDDGIKTFLRRSGNFTGDDIVNIIMQHTATGKFLAAKVLKHFVYDNPEPELVGEVAAQLRGSRFDMQGLMSALLRSKVFYSKKAYRALVKSPMELVIGAHKTLGARAMEPAALAALTQMGQVPLDPPNVAGWPGGALWLNTGTMMARLNYLNRLVLYKADAASNVADAGSMMTAMASNAMDDPAAAYRMSPTVASPSQWVAGASMTDANGVALKVTDLTVQGDVTGVQLNEIVNYLTTDAVGNQVALNGENFEEKVRGAMSLATALPAYQLA